MKSLIILIFFICLSACQKYPSNLDGLSPHYYSDNAVGSQDTENCCIVIAHAGGAIDGNSYSNSVEAVTRNYEIGTRLFELDFELTSDGAWVGTHDWPNWSHQTGFKGKLPPSQAQFKKQKIRFKRSGWSVPGEYSPITFEWLLDFLSIHQDAYIVVDTKADLQAIASHIVEGASPDQFIFQAYSLDDVDFLLGLDGNSKIILTLYKLGRKNIDLDAIAAQIDQLIGITMPVTWAAESELLSQIVKLGLPVYLHGRPGSINSRELHDRFSASRVAGFYLD